MEINFSKQTCYSNKSYKNQFVNDGVSISIETSVGGVSFKVNQGSLGFRWFLPYSFYGI